MIRTGSSSGEGERNGSGEHRICLRKLELSLEVLETSTSMNFMDSSHPRASSQASPTAPICHFP